MTVHRLGLALFQMVNNKCSGTDRILLDFYEKCWDKLKYFVLDLYKDIIGDGYFHFSFGHSIISLLEGG